MDLDAGEAPLPMPPPPAAGDVAAAPATPVDTDPPKPDPTKPQDPAKPDDSERVIELARQNRQNEQARKDAEAKAATSEQTVKKLEPVLELLKLAETNPVAFITEIADVAHLTPERVLEIIQTSGAGGEVELTAEDKIARLERQIEELRGGHKPDDDEDKEAKGQGGEQARQGFLDAARTHLEEAPELFPLAVKANTAADPAERVDIPQAVFLTQVRHWEHAKAQPGFDQSKYRPLSTLQALQRVERVLVGEAKGGAQAGGGLSNRTPAAVVPEADRILTDEEIRADMLRRMNARR